MIRRTPLVALPLVALAIAGCGVPAPRIESHGAAQQDVVGDVRITATLCSPVFYPYGKPGDPQRGMGGPTLPPCEPGESEGQFLVGFLLPDGAPAPATIPGTGLDTTFTPDPEYTAHLAGALGEPEGERWVGYRSATVETDAATTPQTTVALDVPADGDALHYGIETGYRVVEPDQGFAADRALDCAEMFHPPVRGQGPSWPTTVCQSPAPVDAVLALNELELRPPTGGAVQQGGTIQLPFRADFQGDADPTFLLAAATTGGTATVAPQLEPEADSTTDVPVTLTVPADAPLGPVQVTLTATLGGQVRTATATVQVSEKPKPAVPAAAAGTTGPVAKLSQSLDPLARATMARVLRDGVPATYHCTTACDAVIDLLVYEPAARRARIAQRRRWKAVPTILVARRYSSLAAKGSRREVLQLSPLARAGLQRLGKVTLLVRTTAVGPDGERTKPIVRKLRLRAPRR